MADMTDAEMLDKLLAMFYQDKDELLFLYQEGVTIGEIDRELETVLVKRKSLTSEKDTENG